jgi:PAS domain S-box-containing protein
MTHPSPVSSQHGPDKAITLALSLAQAENAIHAFTAGQVDAIIDSDGNAYLLRPAQEELRQNEMRLQALLDSAADVITVVNRAGVILSQSLAAFRVLGYKSKELVGRSMFEFIHKDDVPHLYFAFIEVAEGYHECTTAAFRHRSRDGSYRMIEATLARLRDLSKTSVVLSLRPATLL